MIKKLLAVFLAVVLILLAGCSDNNNGTNTSSNPDTQAVTDNTKEIQLLYCANDTMNPFDTISKLNAELAYLIFDPLIKVDNSFEQILVLAESVETSDKFCTVTLRDAVFSDGSTVTAEDVLYSYNLAAKSSRFSHLFYEIEKAESTDSKTIVFTLKQNDPYFSKLLTFPILKTGSDNLKNEDNVELTPIGSGRFVFDQTGSALVPNKNYFGSPTNISKITLINAPDSESMEHYVEIGATDIYYAEMNDDSIIRMSGKKTSVNLNNLIYLGVNHSYAPLKSSELRYAISSAISRSAVVTSSFYTNAVAATGFFHPAWKEVSGYQTIQSSSNQKISIENLSNIGYNRLNSDGYYENSKGNILTLSILVNRDSSSKLAAAHLIADQLESVGIKVNVNALNKDAYFAALKSGNFQLYLGEVKLLPNMDISSLVLPGGSAAYGIVNQASSTPITENETLTEYNEETAYISIVKGFYQGKNSAVDTASSLLAAMPLIPIAYRSSIVFYSNEIADIHSLSSCDIFLSIDKYKFEK